MIKYVRHNDIKPDNICIGKKECYDNFILQIWIEDRDFYSTTSHSCESVEEQLICDSDVKLVDFGTASPIETTRFTGGTNLYMSPELKKIAYYSKNKSARSEVFCYS